MSSGSSKLSGLIAVAASMLLIACKPTYPKCDKDEDCKEKGEVCVNGQCQECRDDEQCVAKQGQGFACVEGRCEQKKECNADADCTAIGPNLVCRANKCVTECSTNADCPSGKRCEGQKCVAECSADVDCGPNRYCVDGACQDQPAGGTRISAQCRPMDTSGGQIVATDTVHFEFDKYDLTSTARDVLDKDAECLKQDPAVHVVLEGHADERGTQEYNLALGEKRAATVQSYLRNLGIEPGRLTIRSKGENEPVCEEHTESCWAKNRRVEFLQSTR
jgi:peptidoglycan-associated lipoprotein